MTGEQTTHKTRHSYFLFIYRSFVNGYLASLTIYRVPCKREKKKTRGEEKKKKGATAESSQPPPRYFTRIIGPSGIPRRFNRSTLFIAPAFFFFFLVIKSGWWIPLLKRIHFFDFWFQIENFCRVSPRGSSNKARNFTALLKWIPFKRGEKNFLKLYRGFAPLDELLYNLVLIKFSEFIIRYRWLGISY